MVEKTLVFVKPDGVERGLVGEIFARFEKVGLKIVGMKMVRADIEHIKKHYAAHVGKDFYPPIENFIASGPVVAAVLEGVGAVALVRKMVGGTEPHSAAPGTIRGDYAHMNYAYADGPAKDKGLRNVIHASGNVEEAEVEVELWFGKDELFDYELLHEKHTRG